MCCKIIDTHVHIWDLERVEYDWLKDDTSILNKTYLLDQLTPQINAANVVQGVLVQAANNLSDTELMLETAEANSWITGVVGWLPLMQPDATAQLLADKYLKNTYIKGIRHLIHNEPDTAWQLQDTVVESLDILAKNNLPYDAVGVKNEHLITAIKLMEKIPELRIVFDHMNYPPIPLNERFGVWGELMKAASQNPNAFVKISGLGTASGNFTGWTKEDLKPYIAFIIETFGVDRCFCGGDWPVSLLAGEYITTWQAYQSILSELLDEASCEKIFYHNAAKFYNLS